MAKKTQSQFRPAGAKKKQKKQESKAAKKKRVQAIVSLFQRYYPDAECALNYETPLQLLVATILSAQCTDERVNAVTKELFQKYTSAADFAQAPREELEQAIRSTGFYRNKAKNIQLACRALVDQYGGELPRTLEEMTALSGVGRKTANVVLGNAFNIPSGIVVDTHVTRLSNRLGLVKTKNPEIIERELAELVEKKHWVMFSHWLILHGRQICKARKPLCSECFLEAHCPKLIE